MGMISFQSQKILQQLDELKIKMSYKTVLDKLKTTFRRLIL